MGDVVIIDYGSGNLHSAVKAFERAAREASTGQKIVLTSNPDDIEKADRVVLPGVGAFAVQRLRPIISGVGRWTAKVRA